jgi:acyl-CoA dehydrogenase
VERSWPDEAVAYADATRAALNRLGGLELVRAAERDPARRAAAGAAFDELGLSALNPRSGPLEGFAAAAAVREAGASLAPWPVVAQLVARAAGAAVPGVYVVDRRAGRLEHLDVLGSAAIADVRTGRSVSVSAAGAATPAPLDPFGTPLELGDDAALDAHAAVAWHAVLLAHWLIGALGRAGDLAVEHARHRRQFGSPLAAFGAIKWRLSDIELARSGLEELAAYTLWLLTQERCTRADALALRLASAEAARAVLENVHQVLAAVGLCDEHDASLISRHVQAPLRRGGSAGALAGMLAATVAQEGFGGLFDVPPARLHGLSTSIRSDELVT